MPGIKDPLVDILNKVRADLPIFQTVRVWNNQTEHERDGDYVAYGKPACFVEVLTDVQWEPLSQGFSTADVGIKFHLVHEYYDDQNGNFEQDLVIFELRDSIIASFTLYMPPGCGTMMKVNEVQDFDHDNVYHYIVEFVCSFIDDKGVKATIETTPPTALEVQAVFVDPKNYTIQL